MKYSRFTTWAREIACRDAAASSGVIEITAWRLISERHHLLKSTYQISEKYASMARNIKLLKASLASKLVDALV